MALEARRGRQRSLPPRKERKASSEMHDGGYDRATFEAILEEETRKVWALCRHRFAGRRR